MIGSCPALREPALQDTHPGEGLTAPQASTGSWTTHQMLIKGQQEKWIDASA